MHLMYIYDSLQIDCYMNQLCQSKTELWNFIIGVWVFIDDYDDQIYGDEWISYGNQNLTHKSSWLNYRFL